MTNLDEGSSLQDGLDEYARGERVSSDRVCDNTPKPTATQVHYAASQNIIDHVITALRESASTVAKLDGMTDVAMVYDRALGLLLRSETHHPGRAAMVCATWLLNVGGHREQ